MADQGVLGVIAGGGPLTARLLESCRRTGRIHFVIALEGMAEPEVIGNSPHEWVRIGAAGKAESLLRAKGVRDLVMVGKVRRPSLFELRPDARTLGFLAKVGFRRLGDDSLLSAINRAFEEAGFRILRMDEVLGDGFAPEGVLGAHAPDSGARDDIARGLAIAHGIGRLDIGQAAVIQAGIVLGVEAVEGTDALLRRCGGLRRAGPGGVLVKAAKPQQSDRADPPVVGVDTVHGARDAGLAGIAVEAGRVLVVDRPAVVAAADAAGLFLVGVRADG